LGTNKKKSTKNIHAAIIGMGCFFPKASGLHEYWRLIFKGEDGITDIPETHWSPDDYFDKDPKKSDHIYCKRGGFLSAVPFDPTEFGMPPSSLEATDTSQILGLLAAKMALENAGYGQNANFNHSRTSVILGATGTQELAIPLAARLGHPIWRKALHNSGIGPDKAEEVIKKISDSYVSWQENSFPGLLGNVIAGRICNRLGIGGTNCVVDAACASSMGAIYLALLELSSGRSDMVVTGGLDTLNDIFMHMCFSKTFILSPTGDSRPFSKDADGTVLGEGIGLLVLKRLEDAERDGNRIYAVIKGIGSSSDGKSQSIYAPKPEGQLESLRIAYESSDTDPASVELVEAHGTGTRVGDNVEFDALKRLFAQSSQKGSPKNESSKKINTCALGSVKSMIGHTKAAAGTAGLIKAALALYNKVLPPTLKADEPDPKLGISDSPFYINSETRPWFSQKVHPRRSGVSAFGFGGSNFHIVLEEYHRNKNEIFWDGSIEIISLSASTKKEIENQFRELKNSINRGISYKELAIKAAKTRKNFSPDDQFRFLLVLERPSNSLGNPSDDFSGLLSEASTSIESNWQNNAKENNRNLKNIFYGGPEKPGKIAFIFPGQGSQYVGMGRDLVCTFPEAFNILEKANKKYNNSELLSDFIYPRPAQTKTERKEQEEALRRTEIAQPAIGAVSLAMHNILKEFGIKPDATCGHSFGELTALCSAGWIDIDTFFLLSISRGNSMAAAGQNKDQENGAMLAVKASLEKLANLVIEVGSDVILANKNSHNQGVLSGSIEAINRAVKICKKEGLKAIKLPVAAAFHSSLVKNARKPFKKTLKKIKISPSEIPVLSNTIGGAYPYDSEHVKKLLGDHLISPVDFVSNVENLFEMGIRTFIEIGPKSVLTGLVKSILNDRKFQAIPLDCSSGRQFGLADLARTLCRIASIGQRVELNKWERPVSESRKQLMSIPISGANYRRQKTENKKRHTETTVKQVKNKPDNTSPSSQISVEHNKGITDTGKKYTMDNNKLKDERPTSNVQHRTSNNDVASLFYNNKKPDLIINALNVAKQGLESMQTLQLQTAEIHKKFLEAQTESSRTLQNMMKNTQRLAEASMGLKVEEELVINSLIEQNIIHNQTEIESENKIQENKSSHSRDNIHKIENNLLETVSHLTGYPKEMLGLDMDIESDLGIDSIKRVEIFSSLEEKLTNIQSVSPEIMGSLKTLRQIAEFLAGASLNNKPQGLNQTEIESQDKSPENKNPENKNNDSPGNIHEIENNLLETVSQLTGYPKEMLGLDMDIESDLGIDSIKRVEIFSSLEEKLTNIQSVSPEIMGSLKTLRQIAEYLTGTSLNNEPQTSTINTPINTIASPRRAAENELPEINISDISRRVVSIVEKPYKQGDRLDIPHGSKVFVTDDNGGLSKAITEELKSQNIDAVHISKEALMNKKDLPKAAGLIILPTNDLSDEEQKNDKILKNAFILTNHLAPDLIDSAAKGGAIFATITRLDGAFGFKGKGIANAVTGGLAALAKTASIEWESVCCRAIDIAPDWEDNKDIAKAVVAELVNPDTSGPVEIGLDKNLSPGSRFTLKLESSPYQPAQKIQLDLNSGDVVVVTGGARGITASTVQALAKHTDATLILLGRSPEPSSSPEPKWLETLDEEAIIKKAILENELGTQNASPIMLEKAYKKHMANREISRNLEKLRQNGTSAFYFSADIRKPEQLNRILDDVRSAHGHIKGIIHGAGVLDDRLIKDKTINQFERVFDTKVKGLFTLLESTKNDNLRYLVLFSSIAARIGNKGQVDYAMANEVLNKIARKESLLRPDCRVVSINWGPWDGGMVSPSLKREFKKNKIELIPKDAGSMCMLYEMMGDKNHPAEIVIGANIIPDEKKLSLTFKREIDVKQYPVLESHVLDGRPVVPFALIAEWLGHGALHDNPGLFLHGLDDIRILNGIKLEHNKKLIRLMTGKPRKKGSIFEVDVEIRDGIKNGIEVIHTRAKAILTDNFSQPPILDISAYMGSKAYFRSMDEVYDKILFHGVALRGIKEIISYSSKGMLARISSAPSPVKWMKEPLRSKWIGDPLVLDSAFQMAIIWCFEEMGVVSLPTYSASYRQYRNKFPSEGVTALFEVKEVTKRKLKGDFTFLDKNNVVVAQLTGYEAAMDESLFKAFKTKDAANA
jgi:acyl transferase domain-containing protein/NAD(P)-dependent dehydrogenase (short-subunit alcohol dehydrogenase family)